MPRAEGVEADIYVKFEGVNPTGSFKDRGMTVAVTQAVHEGSRAIICASTGNTSAAAAAYAARAGIKAFVLIPEGKIALGKLAQAIVHGATVVQIRGNFDDGMQLVKEVAQSAPVAIVNSINLEDGLEHMVAAARPNDPRCITLRYEDVVTDTDAQLARVFSFLDLDPAEAHGMSDDALRGRMRDRTGVATYTTVSGSGLTVV